MPDTLTRPLHEGANFLRSLSVCGASRAGRSPLSDTVKHLCPKAMGNLLFFLLLLLVLVALRLWVILPPRAKPSKRAARSPADTCTLAVFSLTSQRSGSWNACIIRTSLPITTRGSRRASSPRSARRCPRCSKFTLISPGHASDSREHPAPLPTRPRRSLPFAARRSTGPSERGALSGIRPSRPDLTMND